MLFLLDIASLCTQPSVTSLVLKETARFGGRHVGVTARLFEKITLEKIYAGELPGLAGVPGTAYGPAECPGNF